MYINNPLFLTSFYSAIFINSLFHELDPGGGLVLGSCQSSGYLLTGDCRISLILDRWISQFRISHIYTNYLYHNFTRYICDYLNSI